jgi:hypothetical protein
MVLFSIRAIDILPKPATAAIKPNTSQQIEFMECEAASKRFLAPKVNLEIGWLGLS